MPIISIHRHRPLALALLCSTALTGTLLSVGSSMPANAQTLYGATGGQPTSNSGTGGDADENGGDGTGTNAGSGGDAGTAASHDGVGGGDGNTGGGGGGGYSPVMSGDILVDSVGGNGGNGGRGTIGAIVGGGGGGAGGDGARNADANPNIHVRATVRGGNGGNGGGGMTGSGASGGGGAGFVLENIGMVTLDTGGKALGGNGGGGAYGGGGGAGTVLDKGGTLTAQTGSIITGGNGGTYGAGGAGVISAVGAYVANSGEITGGAGGQANAGGAGISIAGGGNVMNAGIIRGGAGGAAGSSGYSGLTGGRGSGGAPGFQSNVAIVGEGGAGIIGAGLVVMNAGTIAGGTGFTGQANAITFTGGDNSLFLRNGSTIIGNVVVQGGTGALGLGDYVDPNSAFDVSKIVGTATPGATDEFVGFTSFTKNGPNTVTLTGTGAQNWDIVQGTLVGNTGSLGGNISFTGSGSAAGVTFDQSVDGTYSGTIATQASARGTLTKIGVGALRLSGNADLGGGAAIVSGGLFEVAGTLTSGEGRVDYSGSLPGSTASARVSGAGASWINSQTLGVGWDSNGELEVVEGGKLRSDMGGAIGVSAGSSGKVVVSGQGSAWNYGNQLMVGTQGIGTLLVANAGKVVGGTSLGGVLGYYAGSTGNATITGTDSVWSDPRLIIGGAGDGSLTLRDNGKAGATGGNMVIAAVTGSTGTLNIGAGAGESAAAAGTVDAASVQFGDGLGTLVFNHTNTGYVFAAGLQNWPNGTGVGTQHIEHLAGTTLLTGDSSTFNGTTTVSGGKLSVNGALGGTVNVEAGGTLGGSGTVGTTGLTTSVADGGHIAPGNSAGTLSVVGNLALSSGSILDFELGSPGSSAGAPGTSDRIDIAGNLVLDGTLNLAQSGAPADGTAGLGYYRLMTYGGSLADNGLGVGATPTAGRYEIQAGGGNVDLFVAAGGDNTLQHWQGGDGTWNATNMQWLNQGSAVPVAWAGNHAVFKNEPGGFNGGTISVEGTQSFKGLQFVDNGYRLEGPGMLQVDGSDSSDGNAEIRVLANTTAHIATTIGGTGGFSKTEGGTLVLEGANTYLGGTTINAGTLRADTNAALGTGLVTMAGGILLGGGAGVTLSNDLEFKNGTTSTISAGATAMILTGGMSLNDNSVARFGVAGDTGTIEANFLGLMSASPEAAVEINGGTLRTFNDQFLFATSVAASTSVAAGATLDLNDQTNTDVSIRHLLGAGIVNTGTNNATILNVSGGDFSGAITGAGGLRIGNSQGGAGTKALILSGTNTYTGPTVIGTDSTLQLGNGGASGAIGAGAVNNNGALVFNRSNAFNFANLISGTGELRQEGTGITTLSNVNTYTGATTVNAGMLSVNGSIASSSLTTVNAGGTLGGNGTVGNTTINGGTLSPGNSIGTLTIAGNLVLTAASTYMVEVSPMSSDFTHVTGMATLGGATVAAQFAAGSYVEKRYTILTADGGVNGTFSGPVNTNLPLNFKSALAHDGNNAYLDLALDYTPSGPMPPDYGNGLNINQHDVAKTLTNFFNTNNGIPLAFGALDPRGLSLASGEIATTASQAAFDAQSQFLNTLTDPLAGGYRNAARPAPSSSSVLGYASTAGEGRPQDVFGALVTKASPMVPAFEARWRTFGTAYGGSTQIGGNAMLGSHDATSRVYGAMGGVSYALNPDAQVGFAFGGGGTTFGLSDGMGSGRSDMFQAGVFAHQGFGDSGYISSAFAYGWHDVHTNRTVSTGEQLSGAYKAGVISGRLEAGWRIDSRFAGVTPYAATQAISYRMPSYLEQGNGAADSFALGYAGRDVTATRSELGLRLDRTTVMGDALLTWRGRAAWAHNFDTARNATATFLTLPGSGFLVNGAAMAPDAALVSAGAEISWRNGFALAASFEGEFSNNVTSYTGKGSLRYAW